MRSKWILEALTRDLKQTMYADAAKKNWSKAQLKVLNELFNQNKTFLKSYIRTVQEIAQFETYERLFSLWHVFHLPLVYMLAFSSVWHVVAVHRF